MLNAHTLKDSTIKLMDIARNKGDFDEFYRHWIDLRIIQRIIKNHDGGITRLETSTEGEYTLVLAETYINGKWKRYHNIVMFSTEVLINDSNVIDCTHKHDISDIKEAIRGKINCYTKIYNKL